MIGDVNLFLKGTPAEYANRKNEDHQGGDGDEDEDDDTFEVEVEIMIAGARASFLLPLLAPIFWGTDRHCPFVVSPLF